MHACVHAHMHAYLQALISGKVSAVKSMISVCPDALDAPLPQSLIAIPSIRDFTLLRRIGKGGYGSVWVARKKSSGDIFALKAVRRAVQQRIRVNVHEQQRMRVEDIIFKGHSSDYLVRRFFSLASHTLVYLYLYMHTCTGPWLLLVHLGSPRHLCSRVHARR